MRATWVSFLKIKKKKSEFPKAVCAAQPWAHFPFTCGVVGGVWGTETQAASDEKF